MNKNRKMIVALCLVLAVAVAAGFLLYNYLEPKKTSVYMFNDSYTAGTEVTEDMFTKVQVDATMIFGGSNTNTSSRFVTEDTFRETMNAGNVLKMDVSDSMPLTYSMLSVSGGTSVEMAMEASNVAVTIKAGAGSGLTGDIGKNSHVNIYATGWGGTEGTTLIFQNLRVLAVISNKDEVSAITVEVTPEESLKLINAVSTCQLYFALVDSSGYNMVDNDLSFVQPYPRQSS